MHVTGFVPFFRNKFPGLFKDSDWFFQDSKVHINPFTPKILMLILLTVCHTFHIFLLEFNRFPELSRTSSPFPGLSSTGKCHNKILGLSRSSRTRTNPVLLYITCKWWEFPAPRAQATLKWTSICHSVKVDSFHQKFSELKPTVLIYLSQSIAENLFRTSKLLGNENERKQHI